MNYLNGIRVGGNSGWGQAYSRRHMRRVLYLFLKHVVGWTEVSKVGSNWDNPSLAGAADGATHASDAEIFNSATGGFSGIDPKSTTSRFYLLVTGFADSTRDGFYLIKQVITDNQILIDAPYCGVHTDGLPLNETGLTWRVEDFKSSSLVPANNDEYYLRSTGIGGNFQVHCKNISTTYYQDTFRVSPDDGSHWTAYTTNTFDAAEESGLLFGVADATHAYFYIRGYTGDMGAGNNYPATYYFGDITAFRPTVDTKPVVCFAQRTGSDWRAWGALLDGPIRSLTDGNVQISHVLIHPTLHGASATGVLDNARKTRSYYSGRFIRFPLIVVSTNNSYPEVRGYLKSVDGMHHYGDRIGTPFGTGRDRLKIGRASIPWNGSKQYYYIF